MSWAQVATGSRDRLVRRFGAGGEVTVRRHHTLTNPSTGAALATLAVNGTTALGAAVIDLDATAVQGKLVAGITFTIAGDATTYTVAADSTAASNALASVTFTPVLAAEAADDAAVTVTSQSKDYAFKASAKRFTREQVGISGVQTGDQLLSVSALIEPIEITDQDQVLWNGTVFDIVSAETHKHGSVNTGTTLHIRGV